jgi:crotonobetainyl-CoA:carnitine CoA-transferase CaiB-like acyl-CoA transferase
VPTGPILSVQETYENEQVRHLGMAVPVRHPLLGDLTVQAPPATLSRTPGGVRTPAPEAGEHTDAILAELGYSPSDIAALRRDAVV